MRRGPKPPGPPRPPDPIPLEDPPPPPKPIVLRPPPVPVDLTPCATPADVGSATDALGLVRSLLASARADYDRASASYDAASATKFARIAAQLTPVLARLERVSQEYGDVIRIPRDDLDKRREILKERLRALTADLPRCASCGRELRVSWAESNERSDS